MKIPTTILLGGIVALVGTGAYWFGGHQSVAPVMKSAASSRAVEFWYDPMHPQTHFDAPGKSPFMEMQLVPKYADAADSTTVAIDPRMVQNLGIRTAAVTTGSVDRAVRAVGRVEADERSVRRVTVRADGWVEALLVRTQGEHIAEHQLLAQIYSPAFDTAQREFLLALESGDATLIAAARARLTALAVDPAQIDALAGDRRPARRIDVYSPMRGYVMELTVREGDAVTRDSALFELASHDPIWIVADVPEARSASIDVGARAEVTVVAHPGRTFVGTVDYLYPSLDVETRARRARIVLANADDALHPGMYANVTLRSDGPASALLVPTEAVIRTGARTLVIVAEGEGRYRPVAVDIGEEHAGSTVVSNGLADGERVVVSGQFLLDSEASLRGIEARTAPPPNGHDEAQP